MRAEHDVRHRQQRAVGRQRLDLEDVQRGAGEVAAAQRLDQRGLVHDRPAGDVDQLAARLHRGQHLGVHQVPGLLGQRGADHQVVGGRHHVVEGAGPDAELGRGGQRRVPRVAADDVHPECGTADRDRAADAAQADHAHHLAAQRLALDLEPGAGPDRGVHPVQPAGEHQDEAGRDIRHLVAEHARGVGHRDAEPGGGLLVDAVGADAPLGEDLQPRRGLEHRGGEHVVADDHAVDLRHDLEQLGLGELLHHLGHHQLDVPGGELGLVLVQLALHLDAGDQDPAAHQTLAPLSSCRACQTASASRKSRSSSMSIASRWSTSNR